jgi:uracil-DNA glycosylase
VAQILVRKKQSLASLLKEVRACRVCAAALSHEPRPVLRAHQDARVLLVGQAPGARVHATGIPWNDPSGDQLRTWLALSREQFYDETRIAIIPMGMCYPGSEKGADLPPRPECAPLWHARLRAQLPNIKLTLLIGVYAQRYYLQLPRTARVADIVREHAGRSADLWPLPHPSPRNRLWLKKNAWFAAEIVPQLRRCVQRALA